MSYYLLIIDPISAKVKSHIGGHSGYKGVQPDRDQPGVVKTPSQPIIDFTHDSTKLLST
jgi:hypothetical protein